MKEIALLKCKDDMSLEEIARNLLNGQVPFVRALPGLRRWTVNLAVHGEEPAPYEAITEFCFADQETLEQALASEEVAVALRDGDRFVAPPGPVPTVAKEHEVIDSDRQKTSSWLPCELNPEEISHAPH